MSMENASIYNKRCQKTVRKTATTVERTPRHNPAAHDILNPRHSARGIPVVKTNVDQAIATNQSWQQRTEGSPHMVFCTGCDGCGCVELGCKLRALGESYCSTARIPASHNHRQHNQCRTPYTAAHTLVLLMMGIMMPETS